MSDPKLKLDKPVNFRTNEELYDSFVLKCKTHKQKIQDRLNSLIIADLADANISSQEPADAGL